MFAKSDAEKAFEWLRENGPLAAEAKAQRMHLDAFTKTLKARIMREHEGMPVSGQEREALADERYEQHLDGLRVAIELDETFRWNRDRAMACMDGWRTESANSRGI